ncbi:MAG TPA: hypothetical protein VGF23_11340 [Gaiellaceae bacterium]
MLLRHAAVIAAFVFAGLVFAASAWAESPTELNVYQDQTGLGQAADVELDVSVAASAAPTSKLTIDVPSGYALDVARPVGTKIGTATVKLATGSTLIAGSGQIVVADPSTGAGQSCAVGTHAAVWAVSIYIAGQQLTVPVYVDAASPDHADAMSYTLQSCFAAPSAAGGLRVAEVDLSLKSMLKNPEATGMYLWRALVTPFAGEAPDAASTTEVQTIVPLPHRIGLRARYDARRHMMVLSGSVMAGGDPRPNVNVYFLVSYTPDFADYGSWGSAKTDSRGQFTFRHALRRTAYVAAYLNPYFYDNCDPALGTAPCTRETISPPPDTEMKVRVG